MQLVIGCVLSVFGKSPVVLQRIVKKTSKPDADNFVLLCNKKMAGKN